MTLASLSPQAALPSPTTAVWHLGPFPIRAYALCIMLGIVLAAVVAEVRMRRRGVAPGAVLDIALYAVPAGIVGARIYHVISSPEHYFGDGGKPLDVVKIWEGGLGIWGAVAGGALGAWFAARQLGIPLALVADALAPGLPLAQAVGRFGNWFNNELYGGPTTLPWGLKIYEMDPKHPGQAKLDAAGNPERLSGLYHPTFAYEALWNVGVALLVLLADRRWKFGRGRAFALYVMGYTAGRFWIEIMRTDPANEILGMRLNVWTAVLVFLASLIYFLRVRGSREYVVPAAGPADVPPGEPTDSGVSQVDVSRPTTATEPIGYRIVSEEEFRAYQESGASPSRLDGPADGEIPSDAGGAPDVGDDRVPDRADAPARVDAEPDGAARADAGADSRARVDAEAGRPAPAPRTADQDH